MKKYYTLCILLFATSFCFSQGYEFGIVHIADYSFKVVAIPDFASAGNTDISSVGFTLMLPAGNADVTNAVGLLGGRPWVVNSNADATVLTGFGGDGTQDAFLITLDPGQTLVTHAVGDQIDLVSFDVSNMPTTGVIEFLLNTDPIAVNLGGALNSFYNSNIDATTTQDYFSGLASGMESIDFSTLSVDDFLLLENDISVYPNPTSKSINIYSTIEIRKVELLDLVGKQILTTTKTSEININHLSMGVYILKVFSKNGSITKKVIIE